MEKKAVYAKPELQVYGDVAELTLGNSTGQHLDASFPSGTNFSDLTFS